MEMDEVMLETEESMDKSVEFLNHEFASVRTGKASPALVENIDVHISSYGTTSKMKQLAIITTPEPRLLVVQPFDPSTTAEIEKALKESKLGINPSVDGKLIRLPIPELSEERRKEMTKLAAQMAEDARIAVRKIRHEAMDKIKNAKKANEITEDDQKLYEKDVQKLTDEHVAKINDQFERKEADIMKV